jgi:hypothetical protein
MKKDIVIPKVENVYLAVVCEYNKTFKTDDWNVYLINQKNVPLEMVLIVSKGFDQVKETSTMRHKLEVLPAKSAAKVEFMQEEVLSLNNEFKVTFFEENSIQEKTFILKKNTIKKNKIKPINFLDKQGFLIK